MLANTVFTRLQLRSNEGIVVDHSRKWPFKQRLDMGLCKLLIVIGTAGLN